MQHAYTKNSTVLAMWERSTSTLHVHWARVCTVDVAHAKPRDVECEMEFSRSSLSSKCQTQTIDASALIGKAHATSLALLACVWFVVCRAHLARAVALQQ